MLTSQSDSSRKALAQNTLVAFTPSNPVIIQKFEKWNRDSTARPDRLAKFTYCCRPAFLKRLLNGRDDLAKSSRG
jgi:hypothetical protein